MLAGWKKWVMLLKYKNYFELVKLLKRGNEKKKIYIAFVLCFEVLHRQKKEVKQIFFFLNIIYTHLSLSVFVSILEITYN